MWLPKDERRLLAGYYKNLDNIEDEGCYRYCQVAKLLSKNCKIIEYGEEIENQSENESLDEQKEEIRKYIDGCKRIDKANRLLDSRKLISYTKHNHERNVVLVSLTIEGYDLGRRYTNLLERSGLWFEHYRDHWVWLIVAFFGGVIVNKLFG